MVETMAALGRMTDEQLRKAQERAEMQFTGYTLHAKKPPEQQGDTSPRAWALRAEAAAQAERDWLAIEAEWDRRRSLPA